MVFRPRLSRLKIRRAFIRRPFSSAGSAKRNRSILRPSCGDDCLFSVKVAWLVTVLPACSSSEQFGWAGVPNEAGGWVVETTSSLPVTRAWVSWNWSVWGVGNCPGHAGTHDTHSVAVCLAWSAEILRGASRYRLSLVEEREEHLGRLFRWLTERHHGTARYCVTLAAAHGANPGWPFRWFPGGFRAEAASPKPARQLAVRVLPSGDRREAQRG